MTNKPILKDSRKLRLAMTGMVSGAVLVLSAPAHALRYDFGPVSGTMDSTISIGAQVRTEERNNGNVAKANQPGTKVLTVEQGSNQNALLQLEAAGNPNFSSADFDTVNPSTPGAFTANGDDGNLNFDQFDPIGGTVKVNQEVGINYSPPVSGFNNFSTFIRGFYFFDVVNTNFTEDALRGFPDDKRPQSVEDQAGFNATLLDAYISGQFNIAGSFLNVRFGRQVVSWGESTFIQNGVNVINPVEVSNLRTAGAELEEAFIPQEMLYANLDVTRNLSLESFWQLNFEETVPDARGTFFSTNDTLVTDGRGLILGSGMNSNVFSSQQALENQGISPGTAATLENISHQNRLPSIQEGDDLEQFGFAARYLVPQWWSTEFGAFYIRHHSRLPLANWQEGSDGIAMGNFTAPGTRNPDSGAQANGVGGLFFSFPKDIDTFGLTFNTLMPTGTALQGELSYKPNAPKQVAPLELIPAAAAPALGVPASSISQVTPDPNTNVVKGFRRLDTYQFQSTMTHAFGPGFGASQRVMVAEAGAQWLTGMPDKEDLLFSGGATTPLQGAGGGIRNADGSPRTTSAVTPRDATKAEFADDWGWGYRLVALMSYDNVFGSWNVTPSVAWSHDVEGTTPGPSGSFTEGSRSITPSVQFDYLSRMQVNVEYTRFQGIGDQKSLRDRDFASISFSYSF